MQDLRRHEDGSPQRFLDSGFRRKDEGGAVDIGWRIAARVQSMHLDLQSSASSGMTHVRMGAPLEDHRQRLVPPPEYAGEDEYGKP